ncbi:hypothetical protein [Priestia megaterium]|uniref:hypothetical protein n=1 Tax=Priestia megaterium TaxID=1404 RepID=UPI0021F4D430|nr:hypothetical protein [Priestia megaterium]UYP06223.1 hypothetical protein OIJ04_18910 [Priestia megaterium]
MKKYIVFTGSFIVLLFAFQIVSGLFLTFTYVPDLSQPLINSTVSVLSFNYPFLSSIILATFSFIISNKVCKVKKSTYK